MASPYLREALRFVGIRDTRFVLIGPTTGPQEPILARERAHQRLAEMAATF
jgi:FMN-dependent NADH-azoreductase